MLEFFVPTKPTNVSQSTESDSRSKLKLIDFSSTLIKAKILCRSFSVLLET